MSDDTPEKSNTHVAFDLNPDDAHAIAEAMKLCGLQSHEQLYRHAAAMFAWAAKESARGRIIASLDEQKKEYAVLKMAAMDNARATAPLAESVESSPAELTRKPTHLSLIYSKHEEELGRSR